MIQVKQHLSNSESSEDEIEKLQGISDEKTTINCLENLSNEIFYEIFDYLEGCELYDAFLNLNIRFQHLINCSSLLLKIILDSPSETVIHDQFTCIAIPNKHRIVSFSMIRFIHDDKSVLPLAFDSSFSRLESLTFNNIIPNEVIPLLKRLTFLPRLFSLTITCDGDFEELSSVYEMIFNLSMLKYNKLSFYDISESPTPLSIATNEQFSGIEYLLIDHRCTLNELIVILSYTPRLCRLTCREVHESDKKIAKESLNMISSLTRISFVRCFAKFDELEMFITKISPHLQVFRLAIYDDVSYLNAHRWEWLISQNLPQLCMFKFHYSEIIDGDLEVTLDHERMNQFNSSFWIKRKWFFWIYIDTNCWEEHIIGYSFSPYRKRSPDFHEYEEKSNNDDEQHVINQTEQETTETSITLSEMNQLVIADLPDDDDDGSFIALVGSILNIIHITYLRIVQNDIFIGSIIRLIPHLPNLQSLVIRTLSMKEPRCLSIEEARTLRDISNKNKITKVNLQQMSDLTEAQFLINLCSRMQHLEVGCESDVCSEWFIRFILMINNKYIPNLCSLCVWIPGTDVNMVENLTEMIDMEKLCDNYTIKQLEDRIYLRWNL